MKIHPYGDRVLIELSKDEESKTASGIIIPDTADKDRLERGVVLEVGEGGENEDGELVPIRVKPGQKVFFSKPYGTDEIKMGDKKCLLVREDDILAIIEE